MNPITITQRDQVLAHHTTETPLSHYGQPVWIVEQDPPELPGRIHWRQVDGPDLEVQALELRGGWLVCRQADGLLLGIIWSDGNYYADLLENRKGQPVKRLTRRPGLKVRGTLHMDPDNPDDLGALVGG